MSSAVFGKGGSRPTARPAIDDIGSCGTLGPRTLLSWLVFILPLVFFSTWPPPSRTKIIVSPAAPCGCPCSPPQWLVPLMRPWVLADLLEPPRPLFSSTAASRGMQPETPQEAHACSHPLLAGSRLFLAAFCTAVV